MSSEVTNYFVAGPPGVEPRSQDLESRILPLNYGPIVARDGLEPPIHESESCVLPLHQRAINKILSRLSRRCALTISLLVGISLLQVHSVSTDNIPSLVRTGRGGRQRSCDRRQLPYPGEGSLTLHPHLMCHRF